MLEPLMTTYVIYLALSAWLTVWVATVLSKHGRVFLADVFNNDEHLVIAVNQLLVVGFYLINIGLVALLLQTDDVVANTSDAIQLLAVKIGTVALVIGGVHLVNVVVFNVIRRRRIDEQYLRANTRTIRVEPVPPIT